MGKKIQHIRRRNAGFTLMELLAVIAIVGVMVAITAPSLAPIARSTEINRLDNYAKEMYIAVQDQFITMEASGEYIQFNRTLTAAAEARNLDSIGFMPQDAADNTWVNYYYAQSKAGTASAAETAVDQAMGVVIGRSSVLEGLTAGGRFIIELSPRADGTDVYSVFYSEDPGFSYADVRNLASRERQDRLNTGNGYPVGYYCGATAAAPEIPDHFSPRARFVNGEELFLKVQCAGGVGLVGAEQNMEVRVVLSDGKTSQTLSYFGGQDFHLSSSGNLDIDILLDSMREGLHLEDVFPGFEPGADISAMVEVLYTAPGETISTPAAERGQAKANSLFAKNIDGSIEVANVRHMNNLRLLPGSAHAVTQTASIDFDATSWGGSETTELSQATKTYNEDNYGSAYVNPLDPRTVEGAQSFEPIPTVGAEWLFDGRNNQLKNFFIEGDGATGLFATIQSGQVVRNVVLVDPFVSGTGSTGALVGELYGQLDNCGVRLDIHSAEEVAKVNVNVVQSVITANTGGLVGSAFAGSNIAQSYAAINVRAADASNVGGLVGSFAGTNLYDSYASGEVDGANNVGGLVGSLSAGTVTNCYAASDVYAPSTAGGFIGQASGGSISESFAYGRVNSAFGGGFVGASAGTSFSACAYLTEAGYNENLIGQPEGIDARNYTTLSNMRLAADHSFPYKENLMGKAFPFANVLDEHWGNWPASMSLNPILVYYEYYADGTYGFYGTGQTEEGMVTIDTLDGPNGALVIVEDGYALLSTFSIRGFEYSLNGGAVQRLTLAESVGSGSFVDLGISTLDYWNGFETHTLKDIFIYQLPFELQMPTRTAESFLDTLELTFADAGGTAAQTFTYYYNPDFAMLASSPAIGEGVAPEPDTSSLYIRTARQLNRLGYQRAYWAPNAHIVQHYDIDFPYYTSDYLGHAVDFLGTGAYANQPIGRLDYPFYGSFDGMGHAIIDYSQWATGQDVAGLFGSVAGTLKNIHVAASSLNSAKVVRTGGVPRGTLAAGALVAWLDGGTVTGCSASGCQVFLDGNSAITDAVAGGLVGLNQGTVTRSTAADTTVTIVSKNPASASLGVGGLVGGLAGSVTNSYAVNNSLICQATGSGSGRVLAHGGIAGTIYRGGASISNCYGYAFAEDTIATSDDTVLHFDIANPSACAISNCYRLNWDGGLNTGAQDGAEVTNCDPDSLRNAALGAAFVRDDYAPTYGTAYFYDVRYVPGHLIASSPYYPYPLVCTNYDGDYSHFGFDWWE